MKSLIAAFYLALATPVAAQSLAPETEHVLAHVIAHEIGHALIREFDLPLLGNEEVIADDFATLFLRTAIPERYGGVIRDHAAHWLEQAREESLFAEHPSHINRAARMMCVAFGMEPELFERDAQDMGMSGREAAACRDSAPEIARGWRRVLASLAMPDGAPVTEVGLNADDSAYADALHRSEVIQTLFAAMAGIDWHSRITLRFQQCDGTAWWSRNGRTITVCDGLIERLENE